MAIATTEFQFSGLTKCLIQGGLLAENDAQTYLQEAKKKQVQLVNYLVSNKLVSGSAIAHAASVEIGLPFFPVTCQALKAKPDNRTNTDTTQNAHTFAVSALLGCFICMGGV